MSKGSSTRSDMVPQMRAACLAPFVDVACRLGVDPHAILRKARIQPEALADPETPLAAATVIKLIDDTARQSGCENLGLLMAEPRNFASLGPISLLLQHRSTVRAAIHSLAKHQRMLGDVTDHVLIDDGEVAMLRVDILHGLGLRHTAEFAVAAIFQGLHQMSGGKWRPDCIHFRHSAPKDLSVHRRFFQCAVLFDSDFDGMSCRSSALEIANPAANEVMAFHAEACLRMLAEQRTSASITDQVRRAINSLLARCIVTMDSVADNLGLHPRMLQRLLEKEGATFAALLNETRRDLAVRYLGTSNQSVTNVALMLGYSTLSSFSRWFTLEFGKSPAAWRSAGREAAVPPSEATAQTLCA